MKELLEELRKLNETEELSLEDVLNILEGGSTTEDNADGIKDLIEQGEEAIVKQDTLDGYPVTVINLEPMIKIMDYETFKDYLAEAAVDYKTAVINDLVEPYFNEGQYYKDCLEDTALRNFVLGQERGVSKCEFSSYNGKDYVIIEE